MLGSMYPEAARLTALKGADILFYPTAIGWHPMKKRSMEKLSLKPGRQYKEARYSQWRLCCAVNRIGLEKQVSTFRD